MSANYPMKVERGASYGLVLTWRTSTSDGEPIPLGDYTPVFTVRRQSGQGTFHGVLGEHVFKEPEGQTGVIRLSLGADVTSVIISGRYTLELRANDDPNEVIRLLHGRFDAADA